jgi:adenine deaminase
MVIEGNIVDVRAKRIFSGVITFENQRIKSISENNKTYSHFILPGFVDAHIHIESSMLVPSEFAQLAVLHGTVATVSDPHEIANVMGVEGVYYMIENGKKVPLKFNFGAPSCVPATTFETAGAVIDADGIDVLMQHPDIKYLAEMMNYPGVIYDDAEVLRKIASAKKYGKPVDGHAPGLRGEAVRKYIAAGISTDHECFTFDEALEKLQLGMKVIIREGSAAKNFEALIDLLPDYFDRMMFCSDDKHPDDLMVGHINQLVARAIAKKMDIFKVLQVACINPVDHYKLEVGTLQVGDLADFIVVQDLVDFKVQATFINGDKVAENGIAFIPKVPVQIINNFDTSFKSPEQFKIKQTASNIRVIEAVDGALVTNGLTFSTKSVAGFLVSDADNDVLKMTVVNRYQNVAPALAFIKGFGLKEGAIASCVGHDSHNIIAVGMDDESICKAVNLVIENKGGISAVNGKESKVLSLPIAGIMSDKDGVTVGNAYASIDRMAKSMGCTLKAPYMTLSFMALLVIPSLKLSDLGLFDGGSFQFTELQY